MMREKVWTHRFCLVFGWLAVTHTGLSSAESPASDDPSQWTAIREDLLREELEAAATATREHLTHTADGDLIGAAIAEREAQRHRARYLDLRRELARLAGGSVSSPFERNPFAPGDAWDLPQAGKSEDAPAVRTSRQRGEARTPPARWDIYGNPESNQVPPVGTAAQPPNWGMYVSAMAAVHEASESSQPTRQALPGHSVSEAPSRPFLVFRASRGGTTE